MKEATIAIEKYLSEKVDEEHIVHIAVQKTGNLPNRVPFICNVFRQTTLDKFLEEETGYPDFVGPYHIHYTVHARYLKPEKINQLMDDMAEHLDAMMFLKR